MLDIMEIRDLLPHRYPFLLVDRILEIEPGKRAVGIKNVSANEPFFQGHFPTYPVMPGVLIIEAMAQVGGCALLTMDEAKAPEGVKNIVLLTGVDECRFRRKVVPGDQLRMEAVITKIRGSVGKCMTRATVDGQAVAEANVMFSLLKQNS